MEPFYVIVLFFVVFFTTSPPPLSLGSRMLQHCFDVKVVE